mmetsp:Transcript_27193/g.48840  ORF Transcript_27193/g.48840 Transcript_27193/m.48840 type:complete len:360 (+) Transcript_27193:97-1176(+)
MEPTLQYYIHYLEFNKRLDCWVSPSELTLPANGSIRKEDTMITRRHKRRREEENPGEPREDLSNPILAQLERDHEENTKIRNVERVVFGKYEMQPWYYSPYLTRFPLLPTLYVCEYCFKYMRHGRTYRLHLKKCLSHRPPGRRIYKDQVSYGKVKSISVWEVMGSEHKLYCQNLCLFSKLFLDHKTLYYLVASFKFYILTEDTGKHSRIVGYFSKELGNDEYNLACILVLPPYQQKGYGRFMIALSYELSRNDRKIGTPERPLSDMGRVSYKSFWTDTILELLLHRGNLSIKEISEATCIAQSDVLETLNSLNLLKYWKGQHIMNPINTRFIEEHFKQKEQKRKTLKLQPVKFKANKLI